MGFLHSTERDSSIAKDMTLLSNLAMQDAFRHFRSLRASSAILFPGTSLDDLFVAIDYTAVPPMIRLNTFDHLEVREGGLRSAYVQHVKMDAKKSKGKQVMVMYIFPKRVPGPLREHCTLFEPDLPSMMVKDVSSRRVAWQHAYSNPLQARWIEVDEVLSRTQLTTDVLFTSNPGGVGRSKVVEVLKVLDLEWELAGYRFG